jgi:protein involved in polysaccharide export with SLBB domain
VAPTTLALLVTSLMLIPVASGQTPTPDQMEVFRNLPPDQQQAILESMGTSQGTSTIQDGVRRDADVTAPETVQPRPAEGAYEAVTARPDDPNLRGRDTVLLEIDLKATDAATSRTRTAEQNSQLKEMQDLILKGNPYKLDASGVLRLPGVAPIPLAGLTEEQATARLNSDPSLSPFDIKLSMLPLAKIDAEALKPFGYDLFSGVPSTYAPVTDVPVPSEYVVGPGDRFEVQLIGNTKNRYSLVVNRDGRVMFPDLGAIPVSGLRFEEAKARIEDRVSEQMIGTEATVSIGDLRSIRVFVLGEAERPGSYTVSGLATITNALFASGGVTRIGSLRNVQLKRNGAVVQRLDLYDLLLNGDTSHDARLLPGDVIFIPPVGNTAGVAGEIRRPAIYELKGESTAADLLYLGGGLTAEADPRLAQLERIDDRRQRIVLDVDLTNPQSRGLRLKSGDLLRIQVVRPTYSNAVTLEGHVYRSGSFQYRSGLRLTDVLPSLDELKPNADPHYVLIRRVEPGTRRVRALSADLEQALRAPATDANPLLSPRDSVFVFDQQAGRKQYLDPIVEELRRQAMSTEPSQLVRISGRVGAPGEYPLEPGMTIADLVRAGGGLAQDAFGGDAELTRYEVREGQTRQTEVLKINLGGALAGDAIADLRLAPFDVLVVRPITQWSEQETVRLEGEVRFPGEYPIMRGETLRSVIARAGGLTAIAFPAGSVFTRASLRDRERKQKDILADRLQQDLATLSLQSSQSGGQTADSASETLAVGKTLLRDLRNAEAVGRLVIDLDRVMAAQQGSDADLILEDGDRLIVPKRAQVVTVIGEVQNPTSHLYDASVSRDDYVRRSGGTTPRADEKRIYVVRANGSVEVGNGSSWFRNSNSSNIQPGDTVVVPLDAERMRPLPLWTAVTTIIFNMAIAVAAVGSL